MARKSNNPALPEKLRRASERERRAPKELQKSRITLLLKGFRKLTKHLRLSPPIITMRDILKEPRAREALEDLQLKARKLTDVDIAPAFESTLPIIPRLPIRYPR